MKQLIKACLKTLWRWTNPLRRPFERKIDAYLARYLRPAERRVTDESNMLMDHVVRELVRLQRQIDLLHQAIEELALSQSPSAIAGEIEPEHANGERLKAG
jgi:hypothetical protein